MVTTDQVHDAINEILASDGEEAADYVCNDVRVIITQDTAYCAPAAAPVCEWAPKGIFHGARVHVAACDGRVRATYGFTHCPTCKRPISFKEGSE
jgi:hypothetical protein